MPPLLPAKPTAFCRTASDLPTVATRARTLAEGRWHPRGFGGHRAKPGNFDKAGISAEQFIAALTGESNGDPLPPHRAGDHIDIQAIHRGQVERAEPGLCGSQCFVRGHLHFSVTQAESLCRLPCQLTFTQIRLVSKANGEAAQVRRVASGHAGNDRAIQPGGKENARGDVADEMIAHSVVDDLADARHSLLLGNVRIWRWKTPKTPQTCLG